MSNITSTGAELFHVKDLWTVFTRHWYWFAASVLTCFFAAVAYIVVTPPTFTRSATILIKNASKNSFTVFGGAQALDEFSILKSNSDVKTAVHLFQSPQLMETVVERLKLNDNYQVKFRNVRLVDIYDATPIVVETDSLLRNAALDFVVHLLPSGEFLLSDIQVDGDFVNPDVTGKLSKPVQLPQGVLTIVPTALYDGRYIGEDIYFSKHPVNRVARQRSEHFKVSVSDDDAPVIQLSYVDVNPQRAEDILNALISIYNENWIKDRNQIMFNTSEFINERLKVIEAELGHVDENISTYKSKNLLPDLNAVSGMHLTQSSNNTSQLVALQNQLSMARYIRSYMNDATRQNRLLPANTGIDNSGIESQIDKYNSILLQKNSLDGNSSEQNPLVADLARTLGLMKEVIVNSIDDYIFTLDIQLSNIRKAEKITNRKIASNPNQAKYLLTVERQQKVKEELYLFLLQKREENELTQTSTTQNTKIINLPGGGEEPTAPRRKNILIASLIIGLMIPAVILFFVESLNTLVRSKADLKSLNLPFLGEIPNIGRRKGNREANEQRMIVANEQRMIVANENKNSHIINEVFRNICSNIDFMCLKGNAGIVVMMTSLTSGSGKTFTSVNTALSMAMKGERVILLDTDLRNMSLSSIAHSSGKGLTDYLSGDAEDWSDLINKGEVHPNLDVMPVGKVPSNPSELLLNGKFVNLIEVLKMKYDYIFLDCSPVLVATDMNIIAPVCDLVLFIIRAGVTNKHLLPEITPICKKGQFRNVAVLLNDIDFDMTQYRKYSYCEPDTDTKKA